MNVVSDVGSSWHRAFPDHRANASRAAPLPDPSSLFIQCDVQHEMPSIDQSLLMVKVRLKFDPPRALAGKKNHWVQKALASRRRRPTPRVQSLHSHPPPCWMQCYPARHRHGGFRGRSLLRCSSAARCAHPVGHKTSLPRPRPQEKQKKIISTRMGLEPTIFAIFQCLEAGKQLYFN